MKTVDADPTVIVCAGDDNYAMPIAVTLYSALINLKRTTAVSIFILDGGISIENKQRIEKVLRIGNMTASLHWVKPRTEVTAGLRASEKHLNESAFLRLMIDDVIPLDVSTVIYLDSDLVVEANLTELFEQKKDGGVWAVRDYGIPYLSSPGGLVKTLDLLGLQPDCKYYNSGLMLIDLKFWREAGIASACLSYLRNYKDTIQYADQDGLNAVLAGQWGELDLAWNVQVGALQHYKQLPESVFKKELAGRIKDLMRYPAVLHFTGHRKPWRSGLTNPVRHRFVHYLKKSQWFSPEEYVRWHLRWAQSCAISIRQDLLNAMIKRSSKAA